MIKKYRIIKQIVLPVIILILIDQAIKIYISVNFLNKNFYFIDHILGFKPHLNTEYSWLNSISNMGIGLKTHIIFTIIIFLVSVAIYDFMKNKYKTGKLENRLFIFLFAGTLCSLIDKVFWGGSLDYIRLEGFFIFDLKDVYITIFEIIVILCIIFNYKGLRKFNEKKFFHEFRNYMKGKYLKK